MLFTKRFWPGLADGSITMTFRRWKRRQVVAGNRYRTPGGIVEVESIEIVDPVAVTDAEAIQAGFSSAVELLTDLRETPDIPLYRVAFQRVEGPDPRTLLAENTDLDEATVSGIKLRLARMDGASASGPWTDEVLHLIASHQGRRAADLAEMFGTETQTFKRNVRKLKELGLTISLDTGYRLSPRGKAYLAAAR
jgi:hypothetical protein